MKKVLYFIYGMILYLSFNQVLEAQNKLSVNDKLLFLRVKSLLFFRYNEPVKNNFSMLNVSLKNVKDKTLYIKSQPVNEFPFFCAMECKVRERTNIWIKLRAGDDESYRKMIGASFK